MVWSMSRQGECVAHAVAERFCGRVPGERTAQRHEATRQEARDAVLDYRERFSNSERKHAYRGYGSPNAFERGANVA